MLLWVPEGTDAKYLSDLPSSIELGILPASERKLSSDAGRVEFLIAPWIKDPDLFADQLRQMTSLKVIQSYAAGVDRLKKFIPSGVTFCNGRGLHDAAVSEWVVGAVLASYNKLTDYHNLQTEGKRKSVNTDTLEGDTVTIFGYGSIGKAVEKRLGGFGVTINRVGRTERTDESGNKIYALSDLGNILPATNVLVVLFPLTSATSEIVNAALLSQLPKGALVVAAGRGKTVDTGALIAELSSGRLRAVLDTTEPEPIPDGHPLWHTPNLLLTQHSSGATSDYLEKVYPFIHEQLRRYMAGETLMNVVEGEY